MPRVEHLDPIETPQKVFLRALRWTADHEAMASIQVQMTAPTGRRRTQPWRAFLLVMQITALSSGNLLLTRAERVAAGFTPRQRALAGLNGPFRYSQLESMLADLTAGLEPVIDISTGEVLKPPRLSSDLNTLLTGIVDASLPAHVPRGPDVAIDSTDVETPARRRSWSSGPIDAAPGLPDETVTSAASATALNKADSLGWPRVGADGRLQHTIDKDARDGYRSGKNGAPKGVFCGHDVHTAVDTSVPGNYPPLIRAIAIAPAGTRKSEPGLQLIDLWREHAGHYPRQVLADRGYTYLTAEHWAGPIYDRGIMPVLDLHTNQRGVHPGPAPGTIWVDGRLHVDSLPTRLRKLPGFKLGMTKREVRDLLTRYDQREPYAFSPHGKPRRRTQRWIGPAAHNIGRLTCINSPRSLRRNITQNTAISTCRPGQPCSCGKTITLAANDMLQLRQQHGYGTSKWKREYNQRNAVEAGNSVIKHHHGRLSRSTFRVTGTTKIGLMVALIIGAANIQLLATRGHLNDPAAETTLNPTAQQPMPTAEPHETRHNHDPPPEPRTRQSPTA